MPPNALLNASSRYLKQHAHNPIHWQRWEPFVLTQAQQQDKLIFLSIGYAACHWCHVMAREAFSDAEIAALLNAHFICIKVDREERPDVDQLYMTAVQAMGIPGGWPLNVFLMPNQQPFYGLTYASISSFKGLLKSIIQAFQ